jgi:hypothetical protein
VYPGSGAIGPTIGAATGDSTFNNTNVGMPNIVLPAMGIDKNGVSTPAPVQVWNERTGQYQSQEDTTPGVMPGPRGGLDGLFNNPFGGNTNVTAPAQVGNQQGPIATESPYVGQLLNNPVMADDFGGGRPGTISAGAAQGPMGPALGGLSTGTQNLLNPQGAAQINPNSPVAAATQPPPKVNFASAMRPGVKQNVFNKFGTPLNQIRQSPGTTPQAPSVNTSRRRLPRLVRPR